MGEIIPGRNEFVNMQDKNCFFLETALVFLGEKKQSRRCHSTIVGKWTPSFQVRMGKSAL